MAFVPWKDRVTETPHRYKLTEVSADTYDLTAVPGAIGEAGTPVNAANLNKLIQRDGDDIKDTVTTFTEASSRANIGTGEKTSTIFGKIKKWFADLKPHAFNDLATTLGTETNKAPTNKLLNDTAALKVDKTSISTVMPLSSAAASNEKVLGEKVVYDEFAKKAPLANPTFTGSVIVPTTPSGPSAAVSKSYADSVGFARVYRTFAQLGLENSATIAELHAAMIDRSKALIPVSTYAHALYGNTGLELPNDFFYVLEAIRSDNERLTLKLVGKAPNSDVLYHYEGMYRDYGTTDKFTGWKRIINDEDAQTITGIKTFATGATPLITDAPTTDLMAVNKEYADNLIPYDKVIRTQDEFEELIASPTWLGATSVALVGQFTLSTANNSGIKIPATVKQIHGFNSAKITITNFVYNSSTAKGGLWYDTLPTTLDYSIRDLEVDCTGTDGSGRGFYNCTNLTNCTGTGTGTGVSSGYGFYNCTNLTNCTGTGTGTGYGHGFYNCTNLTNCTGTGTGTSFGYGFSYCTNLTNCTGTGTGNLGYGFSSCTNLTSCTGTGTGNPGYGFYSITYASNCKDGGSSTAMWGGTNTNVDGLSTPYSKVIRTQAEFNALIASETWLGAESVALVGQFTYSEANNSGIKVPATVKQIHGFNSAKITITNFVYNSSTAKGGLWYDTLPTTNDYSIRDLEVDCTGTDGSGRGFYNCTNLTNCTGTGTGTGVSSGYGFYNCTNLTNCTGTGTGIGAVASGHGFRECTNLTNCTGTGTGTSYGYGFYNCTNLTNCTGTGTGTDGSGYGFYTITYASNCKDGGSSTNMWGGTNRNIDLDTCRKTLVTADNATLNT